MVYNKFKSALLVLVLSALPLGVFAQTKMAFCFTHSAANGAPDWAFNTVTFQKGKTLRCMVYLEKVIPEMDHVTFKVQYQQNETSPFIDREQYRMDVKPDWLWFYYNLAFDMPGNYKVIILNHKDEVLQESVLHLVSE